MSTLFTLITIGIPASGPLSMPLDNSLSMARAWRKLWKCVFMMRAHPYLPDCKVWVDSYQTIYDIIRFFYLHKVSTASVEISLAPMYLFQVNFGHFFCTQVALTKSLSNMTDHRATRFVVWISPYCTATLRTLWHSKSNLKNIYKTKALPNGYSCLSHSF
jgi:hypothetical protein